MSSEEVATFLLITGVSDELLASQFLEMSGGDLETAVSLYYEHGSSVTNTGALDPEAHRTEAAEDDELLANRLQNETYQQQPEASDVRAPIQSTVQRLVDDAPGFYGDVDTPVTAAPQRMFMGNGPTGIFNQTFGFDNHSHDDLFGSNRFGRRNGSNMHIDEDEDDEVQNIDEDDDNMYSDEELVQETDSEGDITYTRRRVMRRRISNNRGRREPQQTPHQRRLAQLFSPPWDIISKYDLNTAKNIGRQTKKWIIVNIQDMSDFRCQQLNRDLWSSTQIKDVIKENFIFLQYLKDSPVGSEYINYYPFSDYPHIAILDPKTGERVKMWSEVPEASKFIEQLVDFLDRFSLEPGHVNPIVQHKAKIDPDALTEEQQLELAIKKSLGAHVDEEEGVVENGNNENPIVLDSDEDGDYSEFEEISDDDNYDDDVVEVSEPVVVKEKSKEPELPREENIDDLTDEEVFATILPTKHEEPENDPSTTTRLQIRSGDGSRLVRRFNKSDPVKTIYEFIKNDFESVQGGKVFSLTSQRANLIRKIKTTIEEAGLNNAAILLEIED